MTSKKSTREKEIEVCSSKPTNGVFTDGLGISVCKGCPKGITKEEQKYPNNMVFKR